jgi:hypothetical protein
VVDGVDWEGSDGDGIGDDTGALGEVLSSAPPVHSTDVNSTSDSVLAVQNTRRSKPHWKMRIKAPPRSSSTEGTIVPSRAVRDGRMR